jgi:hypothetical protein
VKDKHGKSKRQRKRRTLEQQTANEANWDYVRSTKKMLARVVFMLKH